MHVIPTSRDLPDLNGFAAAAEHALTSPAATIAACAEAVRTLIDRDPDKAKQFLAHLEDASYGLARTIKKFLLYLEWSSRMSRDPARADLAVEGRRALEAVSSRFPSRSAGIRASIPEHPVSVQGPGDRIRIGIEEILENAILYSDPPSEVALRIGEAGLEQVVEICDEGIGVAPEDRAHVVAPFYRTSAARTRLRSGAGLGLALADLAARSAGGRVEIGDGPPGRTRVLLILGSAQTDADIW